MVSDPDNSTPKPASLTVMPTIYPVSPPIEQMLEGFWQTGPQFDSVEIDVSPPDESRPSVLEQLGPSPFERGGFPVIGFLATTYDNVSRYVLDRGRK